MAASSGARVVARGDDADALAAPSSSPAAPSASSLAAPASAASDPWRLRWRRESRVMFDIALPIIASNLLGVTMGMVDIGFIGRVGRTELAAAALGNTVFYLLHYPMLGVMTAVDTLLATAHGAGRHAAYGDWTQTGLIVVTALCVPVIAVMLIVEPLLRSIEQDPELSRLAGAFCRNLTWGIPPYYWTQIATKYLQSQHILAPPVYIALLANALNVLLNWLFIFGPSSSSGGKKSSPPLVGLGFEGAPVATSVSRWAQLVFTASYFVVFPKRSSKTAPRRVIPLATLRRCLPGFWRLALPGAVMLLIEAWSFEVTTLLAGYLGEVALDAHLTMLQLATLAFLSLPFAVAVASTIRIGNALGAGDHASARDAMFVTFAMCLGFMSACAAVFAGAANYLGYVFTSDREVVDATAEIAYIAALFQLADGGQAAAGGVFRGMGRQTLVASRNFLGFWVFGLPVGAALTFGARGVGLSGLWWGLTVGLTVATGISVRDLSAVNWPREAELAKARAEAGDGQGEHGDGEGGEEPEERRAEHLPPEEGRREDATRA